MAKLSSDVKLKIISDLAQEVDPKIIAETYEVSYPTVLRISREYKEALANNAVDKMVDMDEAMLAEVEQNLKEQLPNAIEGNVTDLIDGVKGLQRLQAELQTTAGAINKKIASFILNAKQPSEIESLVSSLCQLQNAFFNKNSTQVNVQNNFGTGEGGHAYSEFLSDAPSQ